MLGSGCLGIELDGQVGRIKPVAVMCAALSLSQQALVEDVQAGVQFLEHLQAQAP